MPGSGPSFQRRRGKQFRIHGLGANPAGDLSTPPYLLDGFVPAHFSSATSKREVLIVRVQIGMYHPCGVCLVFSFISCEDESGQRMFVCVCAFESSQLCLLLPS